MKVIGNFDLRNMKCDDLISLECYHCKKIFMKQVFIIRATIKNNNGRCKFCSKQCANLYQSTPKLKPEIGIIFKKECKNCKEIKDVKDFYREHKTDRYFLSCKKCVSNKRKKNTKILFKQYIRNAKNRNREFNIPFNDFVRMTTNETCYYCGRLPIDIEHLGLDRLDNNIGYSIKNCVPCCFECNNFKLRKSEKEFLNIIRRIYLYQKSKPGQLI